MLLQLEPKYGINYTRGQFYFTYDIGSPVSEGITWFTYKDCTPKDIPDLLKVSHCGVCIGKGMGIAAKGTIGKVGYENLSELFNSPTTRIFFREPLNLTEELVVKIIDVANQYIGVKYDYSLALGFAIANSYICPKMAEQWILRKFNDPNKLICSEFMQMIQFLVKISTDSNFIKSPKQMVFANVYKPFKGYPDV